MRLPILLITHFSQSYYHYHIVEDFTGHENKPRVFTLIVHSSAHVLKRRIITDNLHLGMWPRFYSQPDSAIYALIQSEISPHTCDSSRR